MKPPIAPMMAQLKEELSMGNFFYEPKLDGFRGLLFTNSPRPTLWSRNQKDLGKRFPELLSLAKTLPPCVLDGEIVAVRDGRLDFEALDKIRKSLDYVDRATRVVMIPRDLPIEQVELKRPPSDPDDAVWPLAEKHGLTGAVKRLVTALKR